MRRARTALAARLPLVSRQISMSDPFRRNDVAGIAGQQQIGGRSPPGIGIVVSGAIAPEDGSHAWQLGAAFEVGKESRDPKAVATKRCRSLGKRSVATTKRCRSLRWRFVVTTKRCRRAGWRFVATTKRCRRAGWRFVVTTKRCRRAGCRFVVTATRSGRAWCAKSASTVWILTRRSPVREHFTDGRGTFIVGTAGRHSENRQGDDYTKSQRNWQAKNTQKAKKLCRVICRAGNWVISCLVKMAGC